jgi:hypothetical protein
MQKAINPPPREPIALGRAGRRATAADPRVTRARPVRGRAGARRTAESPWGAMRRGAKDWGTGLWP